MTTRVRLPRTPAAYIKRLPEPVKLGLYEKACFLNGVDLADVMMSLELNVVAGKATATFEVFETSDPTSRLVRVKKAVLLPHAPRYG